MSVQATIKNKIRIYNESHWGSKIFQAAKTKPSPTGSAQWANEQENKVPIFTVNDVEVHVYSSDEHMAVNPDFIDCRGRQGVSHNHEPHDLAGDGPPVGQRHSEAKPACYVNHLKKKILSTGHQSDVHPRGKGYFFLGNIIGKNRH